MNRTAMNQKARKMIAKYCEKIDLNRCEVCGSSFAIFPAHKENRRFYHSAEELADPKQWVALCLKCHIAIESNKEETDKLFARLRP